MLDTSIDLYQQKALRTWNRDVPDRDRICNAVMGLAGETGEAIDHIKKSLFHGHDLDTEYMLKELGDILYYWTILCHEVGVDPDWAAAKNIEKLTKRYPEGFSETASRERVE